MSGLLELAERCEKVEGPDRELDAEIAIAVRWKPLGNIQHWVHDWPAGLEKTRREGFLKVAGHDHNDHWEAPAYTASLDAAMTLVPEGWAWEADSMVGTSRRAVAALRGSMNGADAMFSSGAATPALALTAACLRARTTNPNQEPGNVG